MGKQKSLSFLAIFWAIAFSACSKTTELQTHSLATPKSGPFVSLENASEPAPANAEAAVKTIVREANLQEIGRELARRRVGEVDNLSLLRDLEPRLYSDDLLRDTRTQVDSIQRVYFRYHELLLAGMQDPQQKADLAPILGRVAAKILEGCSEDLRRGCRHLRYFARTGNAKDVVLAQMQEQATGDCSVENSGRAMRWIRAAYALAEANYGVHERRTDLALLACAPTRFTALGKQNSLESTRELNWLSDQVIRIVEARDEYKDMPQFASVEARLIEQLNPWSYKVSQRFAAPIDQVMHRLRRAYLSANAHLARSPQFIARVHEENLRDQDFYLYDAILEKFRSENSTVLKNLGIVPLTERDSLFILIESVATKRWEPRIAASFYRALPTAGKREEVELKSQGVVKNYVQTMFLRQLHETNAEMAKFYRSGMQTSETINEAIRKSELLAKDWEELYQRVSLIREFVGMALQVPNERLRAFGLSEEELAQASRYLVAFPHTILLAYQLMQKRFEMTIRTFFGSFKINYFDVTEYFINGGLAPWFSFYPGERERPNQIMNSYQIFHAIDFAMRTETFAVFGIREEDFLRKLIETLSVTPEKFAAFGADNLQQAQRTFAEEIPQIKLFCAEERRRRESKEKGQVYRPRYQFRTDFDKLEDGLFTQVEWFKALFGNSWRSRQVGLPGMSLYSADWVSLHRYHLEGLEKLDLLRLAIEEKRSYMKMLLELYKNYRKDKGDSAETIAANVNTINHELEKAEHQRRRFLTLVDVMNREITFDCSSLALLRENQLVNELHREEIEHLRRIYRDKLKVLNGEEKYEELIAHYRFQGYESLGYTGLDDFSGDYYHYYKIDAHFRVPGYLAKLNSGLEVVMPPPETMRTTKTFQETRVFRVLPFRRPDGTLLSEEEFVAQGANIGSTRQMNAVGALFFNWEFTMGGTYYADRLNQGLPHLNTLLFRFGEQELYRRDQPACLRSSLPKAGECTIEKRRLMEAEEVVREQTQLAHFLSVKEEEEDLYQALNINAKLDFDFLWPTVAGTGFMLIDFASEGTLFDPKTGDPVAFFDHPYILLSSDLMGFGVKLPWREKGADDRYDPQRRTMFEQLTNYYRSKQAMSYMPFRVDPRTADSFDGLMRDMLAQHEARGRELTQAAEDLRREDQSRVIYNELGEAQPFRRRTRRNLSTPPNYAYLTQRWPEDFARVIREFHDQTKGFYRTSSAATSQPADSTTR